MCIVVVVVMHESNVASYFFEAGNLSDSNAYLCSNVFGPSSSARVIRLSFQIGRILGTCTISSTAGTTTTILPFGVCYVIMHKDYYCLINT